ncbi:MAG: isochorismatase family protein [Puniceicoccaceae bacterium]
MRDTDMADYSGLGLLVVDMQPAFLAACTSPSRVLSRVRFAIRAAELLGIQVFFSEQVPEKLGKTVEELLEFSDGPVFPKSAFSALRAPEIDSYLDEESFSHLLLTGIETPICIYQTALDALARDLQVTLLSDAIGQRRDQDVPQVLQTLREAGCNILPSETVFYSIIASSFHADFREFSDLVKEAQLTSA